VVKVALRPAACCDLSAWPRTAFSQSDTIFMRRMSGGCPLYPRKRTAAVGQHITAADHYQNAS